MSKSPTTTPSKHLTLTRTIHPVGQGAFYSETFRNSESDRHLLTAVYDCGGKLDAVEREINTIEDVYILFISHFHSDHTNGVQKLIKKAKPKIVVIPRISPSRFLVDFVSNCYKDKSGVANGFMLKVLPSMKSENNYAHVDNNTTYESVTGQKNITPAVSIWEYIAYYKEDDNLDRKLARELASILGLPGYKLESYLSPIDYQNIASRLINGKNQIGNIKNAYEKAFEGEHNAYSMLVLSHELYYEEDSHNKFDCLYTGDVNPDDYVLNIVSANRPDYIQVPHHGSNHNHDDKLYSNDRIAFMSVGETNKYRHPGLKTLLYLYDNCKEIHVVTENRKYSNSIIL